jgi:hypothetical protein
MIIWSGLGCLVAVIAFLMLLLTEYVTETVFRDDSYYQNHGWPKLLALALAGAVVWFLGTYLNQKQGRVLIDKESGREFLSKPDHSLFFIRMEYWGPILLVIGILCLFFA